MRAQARGSPSPFDRNACAKLSAFVAVPGVLFVVEGLSSLYQSNLTAFLLVPPLAVIIYLIFSQPDAAYVNARSIVVTPVLGAAAGELCYHWMGLTPWGVAAATLIVLCVQLILRSSMPPALALAVLAMLLRAQGSSYTLGVALATTLCWGIFLLWRRFVWLPLPPRPPATEVALLSSRTAGRSTTAQ